MTTTYDRKVFFDTIRGGLFGGRLTTAQVEGLNALLDARDALYPAMPTEEMAYVLATAYHETAHTMQPVREAFWLSEEWRRKNLRYWPWYGRGYVQITWEENYRTMSPLVGVDLVADKEAAMRPDVAAKIIFVGMVLGKFTGKKLADYIKPGKADFTGARRIVNGTDKAALIAGQAEKFLKALKKAEREAAAPAPSAPTPTTTEVANRAPEEGLMAVLLRLLRIVLRSFLRK